MSWHFVERWLEKASQHATLVGKFWLTFLIVCRMVIIASIGDRVYADEQSEFKCNTQQPGCNNVCFNSFSPISHLRFWSFQILACSMPSIIFVIYSGHKAREKSKLESEAKKRQKERAQRTTGDIRGASTGAFAPSNASIQGELQSSKNAKGANEAVTVATQTNFDDSASLSCVKDKSKKDAKTTVDGRQSSASNRERLKSNARTRRTRADSSDSDPETTPLCTKDEIEKHSTAASLPPYGPTKSKLSHDNVLVWLPAQQPQLKQRKPTNSELASEYAFSTNHNEAPPAHPPGAPLAPPPHAAISHRDPEITKIIKKPNRHFRLYVVSTFVRLNLEFGFLYLQWHLFGFEVPSTYKCKQKPCPNIVDCFPSRPQEKTIFLYFMFLFSILCCVLNVCEFLELIWKLMKRCDCQRLNCCGCDRRYRRGRQYLHEAPHMGHQPFILDQQSHGTSKLPPAMVDEIEPPPIGSVYGAYQPHQFTEKGRDGGGGTMYHQVPTPQATKGIGKHKILHLKPSHSAQQMSQFNVQQAGPASTTPSSQQQHQLQQRAPPTTLPLQVFDQANVMVNMQQQHDSKEHAKKGHWDKIEPDSVPVNETYQVDVLSEDEGEIMMLVPETALAASTQDNV